MRVELVCVGTELLTGKASTHAVGLSERLEGLGLALSRETVVPDGPGEMAAVFKEAWRRADLVICAGGLGPTFDDITRDVWSRVLKRRLKADPALARRIEAKFRLRGLPMPPMNRRQAQVLLGAEVLDNPNGTAPGQRLTLGRKTLVLLPGPASELFPIADALLVPWLRDRAAPKARMTRVWRIFGAPQSAVDQDLRPIVKEERSRAGVEMTWGILAHEGIVDVKVTAASRSAEAAAALLEGADRRVRSAFGDVIFGTGKETLEEAVGGLLRRSGLTLALAESCTGGLLAERLTRVPGSSDYFLEARVAYANAAKTRLLGVGEELLKAHGAVSRECALAMAEGARRAAGSDWALSVTGVAGPGGGTADKPVGLVHIALAGPRGTEGWEHRFAGDRGRVRRQSASWALERLRRALIAVKK